MFNLHHNIVASLDRAAEHLTHCPMQSPAFELRLFHEFLIEQRPQSSAAMVLQCFSDVRLQPAALHSSRLVLLHVIANPCLRQGLKSQNPLKCSKVTQ